MNLWQAHPLAKRHQVGALSVSATPYLLTFGESLAIPTLDLKLKEKKEKANLSVEESGGSTLGFRDFDMTKVGVKSYNPATNEIECFPISWNEYTEMRDPKFRETVPANENFHCLSICGVVKTIDEHMVLSFRSKKVSIYKDMWHVSAAGFVDLETAQIAQTTLFQFFLELEEELGVLPSDIIHVKQLGLCQHLVIDSASVEVCMYAETRLTSAEIIGRAKGAKDSWEGKISTFPIDRLREMVGLESEVKFNPGGAATIIMALGL